MLCFGDLLCVRGAFFLLCLTNSCAKWKEFVVDITTKREIFPEVVALEEGSCWNKGFLRDVNSLCFRNCSVLESCEQVVSYSWNKAKKNPRGMKYCPWYSYIMPVFLDGFCSLVFWNTSGCIKMEIGSVGICCWESKGRIIKHFYFLCSYLCIFN